MNGLIDLHSHTTRCGHASGEMQAYVERALALGLRDFGFSDHSHWMLHDNKGRRYAMQADEHPGLMLVRVRVGESILIARLTTRSAHELGIHPGQPIWLQVKSVALVE